MQKKYEMHFSTMLELATNYTVGTENGRLFYGSLWNLIVQSALLEVDQRKWNVFTTNSKTKYDIEIWSRNQTYIAENSSQYIQYIGPHCNEVHACFIAKADQVKYN